MGKLVDTHHRLVTIRGFITAQKLSSALAYGLFVALFFSNTLLRSAAHGSNAKGPIWALFVGIVVNGVVLKLATVGVQVTPLPKSATERALDNMRLGQHRERLGYNHWT